MSNIDTLRQHLFDTIAAVREGQMELDKARVINELCKSLNETGRVEVDFIQATGGEDSAFLKSSETPAGEQPPRLTSGVQSITRHLMGR